MLDIKFVRDNPGVVDRAMTRRGLASVADHLLELDGRWRRAETAVNELRERRNEATKAIGKAKAAGDTTGADIAMQAVGQIKQQIQDAEDAERTAGEALQAAIEVLPNLLDDDVPDGADERENVERHDGSDTRAPAPMFDFEPKEHFDIAVGAAGMDFEAAAKLSGSRFVVLSGQIARLERALGQFMLDLHTQEHGYLEVQPPLLVREAALFGTGQLPKFEADLFYAAHRDGRLGLIPTAEVPLTNLVADSILAGDRLPMRLTALTPCFRSEAGAAGRDQRGMLRQHQFNKVEMVSIVAAEDAEAEHERMLSCAETVLKRLGLNYRVMLLCAGDTGFGARKTFDLEVWLPGQNTFREISSVSNCGSFQARRMGARYRDGHGKAQFVHTLNGSGVAVGRALIAVLENYQQADGSVVVPEALRPYLGGLEMLSAN